METESHYTISPPNGYTIERHPRFIIIRAVTKDPPNLVCRPCAKNRGLTGNPLKGVGICHYCQRMRERISVEE